MVRTEKKTPRNYREARVFYSVCVGERTFYVCEERSKSSLKKKKNENYPKSDIPYEPTVYEIHHLITLIALNVMNCETDSPSHVLL